MRRAPRSTGEISGLRRGWFVFGGLAVLTGVENVVSAWMDSGATVVLVPFALGKAWLILDYFMHVRGLVGGEEPAQ